MNAIYTSTLKAFACGAAAVALTAVFSWSFVESTSVARLASTQSASHLTDASLELAGRAAKSGVAALVD
jgi:acyl-CoA reductase-like NAD-dependent aldehyde dehydrogenase